MKVFLRELALSILRQLLHINPILSLPLPPHICIPHKRWCLYTQMVQISPHRHLLSPRSSAHPPPWCHPLSPSHLPYILRTLILPMKKSDQSNTKRRSFVMHAVKFTCVDVILTFTCVSTRGSARLRVISATEHLPRAAISIATSRPTPARSLTHVGFASAAMDARVRISGGCVFVVHGDFFFFFFRSRGGSRHFSHSASLVAFIQEICGFI